jgi:hypothetical protein
MFYHEVMRNYLMEIDIDLGKLISNILLRE